MAETVAPVFRVGNAAEAVGWYRRLGLPVQSQSWGRDLEVVDPWGNRLRMGVIEG